MKKKLILTTILALMIITLSKTTVNANYQSIPTSSRVRTNATTWITGIRQMEKSGQTMGLTETINTSNALATSGANNIDVHLQKNTEYGAAILLGASAYGKQGKSIEARRMDKGATTTSGTDVKATTTGNVTGIYEMGYYEMNTSRTDYFEWTAGGRTSFLSNIAPRYRNIYTTETGKVGDATTETKNWYGSNNAYFVTGNYGFGRGSRGTFGYASGAVSTNCYGHAAIVSGIEL